MTFLDGAGARSCLMIAVVAAFAVYVLQLSLDPALANHDVGWTIYAGAQLLDGAEFGVDLIDNNPPLIYWMSAVVNAAARAVDLPVFPVYNQLVLALLLGSAWLCRRLLSDVVIGRPLLDALAVGIAAVLVVVPGYGFSQRDQIIAALVLPYVVSTGLTMGGSQPSRALRWALGLGMGLALSLKPHYLLVWVAVELVVMFRLRRFLAWSRLENWLMAAVGVSYVGAVVIRAPAYLGSAREALAVYHTYNNPVAWLSPRTAVLALALCVLVAAKPRSPLRECSIAAASAAVGSFLAVLAQQKDFDYHYVPMLVAALLVVMLSLLDRMEKEPGPGSPRRYRLVFALTIVSACVALAGVGLLRERFDERQALVDVIVDEGDGRPVLYFSSSVDALFPALNFTSSVSASPYSCLWLIAGNYTVEERQARPFPYRAIEEMGPVERGSLEVVIDALERRRPGLLFFERNTGKQGFGITLFEFERYYLVEPRFAELMDLYRPIGLVGTAMAYRLVGNEEG